MNRSPRTAPSSVHPVLRLARLVLLLLCLVPPIAWFAVKPVRLAAPTWAGMVCTADRVCVEDAAQQDEARRLRNEAMAFVAQHVVPLKLLPRVLFCSSQACADHFGLGARAAVTLGRWGTVVGPRAWLPYYLRHELIHVAQAQQLGVLPLLFKPGWWVEGMAYALSEDPRVPLNEPWESHRSAFRRWYTAIHPADLWTEARRL